MQRTSKTPSIPRILAASALFLAVGGTAFAQTAAPASAPLSSPTQSAPQGSAQGAPHADGKHHRNGQHGHHGHRGHHGHHGAGFMKALDTDKDGAISKAEADAAFERIDANKDGKLQPDELKAYRKTQFEQHRAEMKAKFDADFKAADKNGDGALSKDEAQAMPRLARNYDKLDANRDGKLTQAEIRAGMQKMHQERAKRAPRGNDQPNPAVPSSKGG